MKLAPESGFYRIIVSLAASSDVKLLGTSGAEVWFQFPAPREVSIIYYWPAYT